ncbi:MAG: hypothetical protein KKC75_07295 [Nanoarchaeota archaeon]|nr:hypothetical protein [Nanoarchaeota archaeon]
MKFQTSITIEEDIMFKIKDKLRDGSFRNQSHLFEFAVRKLLEKEEL